MNRRKFEVGILYKLDLTGKIKFGPIPQQLLWHKFTDGRVFGLLGEALVKAIYNNLSESPSASAAFDFIDADGKTYEVRTITKSGASLLPSAQIGAGRKFDEKDYLAKRKSIYAYIFIDNRQSPIFRIAGIKEEDLPPYPPARKITLPKFEALISNLPQTTLRLD